MRTRRASCVRLGSCNGVKLATTGAGGHEVCFIFARRSADRCITQNAWKLAGTHAMGAFASIYPPLGIPMIVQHTSVRRGDRRQRPSSATWALRWPR